MKTQIIKNFWSKCFRKRGFTLGETVASMVSLSIVALSAQSLIMMSGQFRADTKRSFASLEDQNHYHNLICSHFQNPVAIQVDRSRTYHYDSEKRTYFSLLTGRDSDDGTRIAETNQPTLAYIVEDRYLGTYQDLKGQIPFKDKSIFYIEDGKREHNASHYDRPSVFFLSYFPIYADSHTLINYVPESHLQESLDGALGKIKENSGFIVATRCIKNTEFNSDEEIGFLHDFSDFNMSEYENVMTASKRATQALYILSNQKVPFYIDYDKQNGKKGKTIICADHKGSIKLEAGDTSVNEYTPVTFIIEFEMFDAAAITKIKSLEHQRQLFDYHSSNIQRDSFGAFTRPDDYPNEDADMFSHIPSAQSLEYANRVRDEFSMAVKFTRITEVPFGASSDIWSSSFIATSPITQTYPSFFNLDFLDVKSTCNPQLYKCPLSPAGKNLSEVYLDKDKEKRIADFFRLETKSCPFRYTRLDNTGQAVSLGVTIIPE